MIKGAIFDLDGTLLDSMFVWDNIGENYLRSLGQEPKENLSKTLKTFSLYQTACYFHSEYGINLSSNEIMNGINAMVEDYYFKKALLKPNVKDFLKQLKHNGVRMCIATVTDKHLAVAALKLCGIYEYFSEIFTCASVGYSKESPVIYRKALEHLGTEKNETVVFEDAFFAAKTAKDDGFLVAAVYDKHESRQKELKSIADFYITDYSAFDNF